MSTETRPERIDGASGGWRFLLEAALWVSVLMTAAIHGTRIQQNGLRGEEPRRGLVATEMIRTGDWIVPRQQGQIFISRPPLQNWIIAGTGMMVGEIDRLAIRLPSLIALLLTTILIYGYSRRWLSSGGAMLACLGYATMGQVLELGALGETESMYTLIVAGSILLWHYAWVSNGSPWIAWSIGYGLAAAGMLAKGYQAPVYFAAAVTYLVISRDWRSVFTGSHVIGILCFFVIWNAWNLPYLWMTGWDNTIAMYQNDVSMRFEHQTWKTWAEHLILFPVEVMVCMMPWSLLLPILAMPRFWKGAGRYREPLTLSIIAIAMTFPSVWFTPGAHGRYYMPLYPCFAVLIAIAAEKVFNESWLLQSRVQGSRLRQFSTWLYAGAWRRYLRGSAAVFVAIAAVVVVGSYSDSVPEIIDSPTPYWLTVIGLTVTAVFVLLAANRTTFARMSTSVFAFVAAIGMIHVGIIGHVTRRCTNDARTVIAKVRDQIPEGQSLHSLGLVDHLFALHYQQPIPVLDRIKPDQGFVHSETYVCYNSGRGADVPSVDVPSLDIPSGVKLETIATINCKRSKNSNRSRQVTVAKCVWDAEYLAKLRETSSAEGSKKY